MTTPIGSNPAATAAAFNAQAAANAAAATQGTSKTSTGNEMTGDAFLKLLVAQLKYQDPSKPVDSAQYMTQMAQFTTVEKLANLEKVQAELASWQRTIAGEGMVGQHVSATDASGNAVEGDVLGMQLTSDGATLMLQGGVSVSVS